MPCAAFGLPFANPMAAPAAPPAASLASALAFSSCCCTLLLAVSTALKKRLAADEAAPLACPTLLGGSGASRNFSTSPTTLGGQPPVFMQAAKAAHQPWRRAVVPRTPPLCAKGALPNACSYAGPSSALMGSCRFCRRCCSRNLTHQERRRAPEPGTPSEQSITYQVCLSNSSCPFTLSSASTPTTQAPSPVCAQEPGTSGGLLQVPSSATA
mmetsp:Transcript_15247/g.39295  ORF Transcript_15247/g.39295 Transcript_15247/m.39295 type:complete len:212 (+) Transcript_15247:230-865(+)